MNSTYPELFVRLTCHNERILMAVLLRIKERRLVSWVTVIVTKTMWCFSVRTWSLHAHVILNEN